MTLSTAGQRPGLRTAVRWAAGFALVAGLVLYAKPSSLVAGIEGVDWSIAAPAIVGLVLAQVLNAAAWRAILFRTAAIGLGWGQALSIHFSAQAAGAVSPANVGADAYRSFALSGDHGWTRPLPAIVVQRVTSFLALLTVGLAGFLALPIAITVDRPLVVALAALILLPLTLVAAIVGAGVARRVLPLRLPTVQGLGPSAAIGLLAALAFHASSIGLGYLLVLATGASAPLLPTLAALAAARLAIAIPFTPLGLGFQEGALAALLPQAGVSAAMALTMGILGRVSTLATVGIGAALLVTGSGRRFVPTPGRGPVRTGQLVASGLPEAAGTPPTGKAV